MRGELGRLVFEGVLKTTKSEKPRIASLKIFTFICKENTRKKMNKI